MFNLTAFSTVSCEVWTCTMKFERWGEVALMLIIPVKSTIPEATDLSLRPWAKMFTRSFVVKKVYRGLCLEFFRPGQYLRQPATRAFQELSFINPCDVAENEVDKINAGINISSDNSAKTAWFSYWRFVSVPARVNNIIGDELFLNSGTKFQR